MNEKTDIEKQQKKFSKLYKQANFSSYGGIFTKKRRKQLLGLAGKSGRNRPLEGQTKASFWYDVRESVRNGLIDLQLFTETSGEEQVNKILTRENLEPLIFALLVYSRHKPNNDEDVSVKAKIAHMLVEYGLNYLRSESGFGQLRKKEEQELDEAIELSNQLAFRLLSSRERTNIIWDQLRKPHLNKSEEKEK